MDIWASFSESWILHTNTIIRAHSSSTLMRCDPVWQYEIHNVNNPLIKQNLTKPNLLTWHNRTGIVRYGYYWNSASKVYFSGLTTKCKVNSTLATPVNWGREETFKLISLWSKKCSSASTERSSEEQLSLYVKKLPITLMKSPLCNFYLSLSFKHLWRFFSIIALLAAKDFQ